MWCAWVLMACFCHTSGHHSFELHTFDKPFYCDACQKLLHGCYFQGYHCSGTSCSSLLSPTTFYATVLPAVCKRASHRECLKDIDRCSSLQPQSKLCVAALPSLSFFPRSMGGGCGSDSQEEVMVGGGSFQLLLCPPIVTPPSPCHPISPSYSRSHSHLFPTHTSPSHYHRLPVCLVPPGHRRPLAATLSDAEPRSPGIRRSGRNSAINGLDSKLITALQ